MALRVRHTPLGGHILVIRFGSSLVGAVLMRRTDGTRHQTAVHPIHIPQLVVLHLCGERREHLHVVAATGRSAGSKKETLVVGRNNLDLRNTLGQRHTIFIYIEHLHRLVALVGHLVGMRRCEYHILLAIVLRQRSARRRLGNTAGEVRNTKLHSLVASSHRHRCTAGRRARHKQIEFIITGLPVERKRLFERKAQHILGTVLAWPHNKAYPIGHKRIGNQFRRISISIRRQRITASIVRRHHVNRISQRNSLPLLVHQLVARSLIGRLLQTNGKRLGLVAIDVEHNLAIHKSCLAQRLLNAINLTGRNHRNRE